MEFKTSNLPFSAALLAAGKLELLRIEATVTQATLIFSDPDSEGENFELEYLAGKLLVPANVYNTYFRSLRRSMEIKLAVARQSGGKQ